MLASRSPLASTGSASLLFLKRFCMSNPSASSPVRSQRSIVQLMRPEELADLEKHVRELQAELERWQAHWQQRKQTYAAAGKKAAAREATQALDFLEQFVRYRLDWILELQEEEQQEALKFFIPFCTDGGMETFLSHFFQFERIKGQLEFVARDDFLREAHILYDLYKIRKTIETIDVIQQTVHKVGHRFPSRYTEPEKEDILVSLRKILEMLMRNTLQPEYQKQVYQQLNPKMIGGRQLLERREQGILYCYPHVVQKYNYRNLIFLLYFREGMETRSKGETVQLHYNYLEFEILKQEFLAHWLQQKLEKNPSKEAVYATYEVDGETIAKRIQQNPQQELPLLKQLPTPIFNDIVARVNIQVDPALRSGTSDESEKYGEMGEFRKAVNKSQQFTRVPLETLRDVAQKNPAALESLDPEVPLVAPTPQPAAGGRIPADFEEPFQLHLLTSEELSFCFLTDQDNKYNGRLNLYKNYLEPQELERLQQVVNLVLHKYTETPSVQIRRYPKHDWVIPYLVRENRRGELFESLLILGGEASVKPKGMLYSVGDEYQFKPYFVFGSFKEEKDFGNVLGERQVRGQVCLEYDVRNEEARRQALRLVELVWQQEAEEV